MSAIRHRYVDWACTDICTEHVFRRPIRELLYYDILKFAGFTPRTCGQSNPVVRQQRLIGATNISEAHLSRGDLEIVHYRMVGGDTASQA